MGRDCSRTKRAKSDGAGETRHIVTDLIGVIAKCVVGHITRNIIRQTPTRPRLNQFDLQLSSLSRLAYFLGDLSTEHTFASSERAEQPHPVVPVLRNHYSATSRDPAVCALPLRRVRAAASNQVRTSSRCRRAASHVDANALSFPHGGIAIGCHHTRGLLEFRDQGPTTAFFIGPCSID